MQERPSLRPTGYLFIVKSVPLPVLVLTFYNPDFLDLSANNVVMLKIDLGTVEHISPELMLV